MTPMRIGIYAPNMTTGVPSGVERYISALVRAMVHLETDHEYVVFSDGEGWPSSPRLRRVPLPPMGRLARLRYDHGRFARVARREKIDLVHCTKSFVPARLDVPGVATVFDVIFLRHPEFYPFWGRWYWGRCLRKTVERASGIVCISGATARDLETFLPDSRGKTWPVPLGIDSAFGAIRDGQAEGERQRLGAEGPYFLFVGNLTVRKNVPVLLEALDEVRRQRAATLVVVGAPDYGAREIVALMERPGRRGTVKYLGNVKDETLAALYKGAAALVYPSQYEGFGLPALEAMICGCPVVASAAGALPEVVGDAGLLVEPGSATALAEAMGRVLEDNDLRENLIAKGRARAAEFSWKRTAEKTIEVYNRVVSGKSP